MVLVVLVLVLVGAGRILLGPRRGLRSRTLIWFWALSALIMRFQAANNFSSNFSFLACRVALCGCFCCCFFFSLFSLLLLYEFLGTSWLINLINVFLKSDVVDEFVF